MSERDKTQYLRLIKPMYEEAADVKDLNDDLDILDEAAGRSVHNIERNGTTYTVTRADGTTFTFTQQDTTYSQISRGSGAGLCPGLPSGSGTTKYLREDGSWATVPTYSQISRGSGAGLCPGLPSGSGTTKFLREDGTWNALSNATTSASGLMSSDDKTKLTGISANANKVTFSTRVYTVTFDSISAGWYGEALFNLNSGETCLGVVGFESDHLNVNIKKAHYIESARQVYVKAKNDSNMSVENATVRVTALLVSIT